MYDPVSELAATIASLTDININDISGQILEEVDCIVIILGPYSEASYKNNSHTFRDNGTKLAEYDIELIIATLTMDWNKGFNWLTSIRQKLDMYDFSTSGAEYKCVRFVHGIAEMTSMKDSYRRHILGTKVILTIKEK